MFLRDFFAETSQDSIFQQFSFRNTTGYTQETQLDVLRSSPIISSTVETPGAHFKGNIFNTQ
jgi:hypothetical protein